MPFFFTLHRRKIESFIGYKNVSEFTSKSNFPKNALFRTLQTVFSICWKQRNFKKDMVSSNEVFLKKMTQQYKFYALGHGFSLQSSISISAST